MEYSILDLYIPEPEDNEWNFFATTYDGATSKIYLNGNLEKSGDKTGNIGNSAISLTIGKFSSVNANYFSGSIDDVMIYNRALSADEITEVYNQTITK